MTDQRPLTDQEIAEGWARMSLAVRATLEQHHALEHRYDGGTGAARCPIGLCGKAKRTVLHA